MKTVKILGDALNKVADTSTVFDFRLWNGGQAQDVTGKTVSFTIANDSGYLFDVPAVVDGNVISLDFSNEQLKQLTPDTYHMEVYVTNGDGDVEVYPSQGTIDFTVGKNLHSTQGKLVPQITFDTVLRSVDEKIAEYTKTITNGDKGDMDLSKITVGGRNYILNSKFSTAVDVPALQQSVDPSFYSDKQVTTSVYVKYNNVKTMVTDAGPFKRVVFAVSFRDASGNMRYLDAQKTITAIGESFSGRVSQTIDLSGFNVASMPTVAVFITNFTADYVEASNPKLEIGNIATDWSPAPEDAPINDLQLVHKTGNEVLAGDKTFTGKVAADNLISNDVPVNLTKTTTFKSWFGSEVTAYRNGNVVTIVNNKQNASLIFDTTHSQEAIPLGYRPSVMVLYPVIYETSIKGQIQINTDGTFQAHGAIDGPYQLTATYITSDSWPV